MKRQALIAAAYLETWAILPHWLTVALAVDYTANVGESQQARLPTVKGDVAILPLHGPISQRGSIWQEVLGGTATEQFGAAYTRSVNEPKLGAVVINVDSPGGTTAGVQELADLIHRGSQIKPTYAVANSQAASAAYWVASQVGKGNFFASPGSELGSIGVYRMHQDVSEALAKEGVKVKFISVPEHKTEANPYEPLGQAAFDHHLEQVQATYERFTRDVARGRNASLTAVKSQYGKGRSYNAEQAVERGMVDRVATLGDIVRKLAGKSGNVFMTAESSELMHSLCEAWDIGIAESMADPIPLETRKDRLKRLTQHVK